MAHQVQANPARVASGAVMAVRATKKGRKMDLRLLSESDPAGIIHFLDWKAGRLINMIKVNEHDDIDVINQKMHDYGRKRRTLCAAALRGFSRSQSRGLQPTA